MRNYILSIDLGGTNVKLAILNKHFAVRIKVLFSTKKFSKSRNTLITEIVKRSFELLRECHIIRSDVLGVGVGVPGPVDFKKGQIRYLPNIPSWENTPIRKILSTKMRLKVVVDNDANLMALAESRMGVAKGARNAICVTLGTGVGGGLILDGKIFRGANFGAGEIGHIPISIDGPYCSCGGRACLERYVGNSYLLREAKKKFRNKNITLECVSELAGAGNKIALLIYRKFANKIGIALSGVVNVLNPEIIVIGGGLSSAWPYIYKEIRATITKRAMPDQARFVKLKKALLGNNAGYIGAAILVKDSLR